jgi:hypothetical protein
MFYNKSVKEMGLPMLSSMQQQNQVKKYLWRLKIDKSINSFMDTVEDL